MPKKPTPLHLSSLRYRVNAGINLPVCAARANGPTNMDATGWPQTRDMFAVTCKHCLRYIAQDTRP